MTRPAPMDPYGWDAPRRRQTPAQDGPSLFDTPPVRATPPAELRGMVHREEHSTAIDAARAQLPDRTRLQHRVLLALAERGPMADADLARDEEFRHETFAYSTLPQRRVELRDAGLVEASHRGLTRNAQGRECAAIFWRVTDEGRRVVGMEVAA